MKLTVVTPLTHGEANLIYKAVTMRFEATADRIKEKGAGRQVIEELKEYVGKMSELESLLPEFEKYGTEGGMPFMDEEDSGAKLSYDDIRYLNGYFMAYFAGNFASIVHYIETEEPHKALGVLQNLICDMTFLKDIYAKYDELTMRFIKDIKKQNDEEEGGSDE